MLTADIFVDKTAVEGKIAGNKKKFNEVIRSYRLKNEEIRESYQNQMSRAIRNRVEDNTNDIDGQWRELKGIILETARSVCGVSRQSEYKKQTAWWNSEVIEQVRIKKQKWREYLRKKTPGSYEEYKCERVKTKRLILRSKEEAWEEFGRKMETSAWENQKVFYRVLKNMKSNKKGEYSKLKDEKGQIITSGDEIMDRWRTYFEGLLNERGVIDSDVGIPSEEGEQEEIKDGEIDEAIRAMKNGKAPGVDKITTEMVKNMGRVGKEELRKLLNPIWQKGTVPEEWEVGNDCTNL